MSKYSSSKLPDELTLGPSMHRLMSIVEPQLESFVPTMERRSPSIVLVHEIGKILRDLPADDQIHLQGAMAVSLEREFIRRTKRRGFPSIEQLGLFDEESRVKAAINSLIFVGDDNTRTPFIKMIEIDWNELHEQDWDRVKRDTAAAQRHDGLHSRLQAFLESGLLSGDAVVALWREIHRA